MGRKKRRGVSFGTVFMLLLTALVVLCFVVFLSAIAGEDLYDRTGDVFRALYAQEAAPTPEPTSAPAAASAAAPAAGWALPASLISIEPTPTPVPQAATFTLAAAGTVYAPKAIRQSVQHDDHFDFDPVFAGLGDTLSAADLAIVTMETTTAGSEKGYGNYNTPTELLDALRACGVDMLSLATERALDKGIDGLRITLGELATRGLASAGVTLGDERGGTDLIGIGGVKVAVLAYTYGISDEGRDKTRASELSAVHTLDMERVTADITRARVDGANVVIVLPHWGTKNRQETPEDLRRMARTMATAGADVILGTHPNVVLDTERLSVTRADGLTYESVVCYSLGSLLTDARTQQNTAGMVAHLNITYDPVSRRTTLGELACTPVYIAQQREDGQNVYRVVDTENAQALSQLGEEERAAAQAAAELVRSVTGQAQREEEGQG